MSLSHFAVKIRVDTNNTNTRFHHPFLKGGFMATSLNNTHPQESENTLHNEAIPTVQLTKAHSVQTRFTTSHSANAHIHAHLDAHTNSHSKRLVAPFVILIALAVTLFSALYFVVAPQSIEKIALNNLKPSELQVMNFNGVFASPNAEGMRQIGASPDIARTLTSGELIFDLTRESRTSDEHGYTKSAKEWYIKTPILGEEAVIITPAIALGIGLGAVSLVFALLVSLLLPPKIGFMAALVERSIAQTRINLHLQTGLSEEELDILSLSDEELLLLAKSAPFRVEKVIQSLWNIVSHGTDEHHFNPKSLEARSYLVFRRYCLQRMEEILSPNVAMALHNLQRVHAWQRRKARVYGAFKFYMEESFVPKYSNVVSGLAYGGAAFLIVSVGLRGLRFIPASRPSVLLATISLECVFLVCLGLTLAFQREESDATLSMKRIQHGMNDVARVMQSVDTSVIQRVLQESAAEYARTPEMQERVFENIAEKALDALRGQAPIKAS
jgi:hypothetical protein